MAVAALALGSAAALSSCEDDLELKSFTQDDIEYAFKDEYNAELYVKGCYRGLIHEENYRQMNTGETITLPCEEALSGGKWMVGNYDFDPILPAAFTRIWNEGYRIIEATNVGLKYVKGLPETKKRKALEAELLFIRAYCYHNIIRVFGDCPARFGAQEDMDPNDSNTFYPVRNSRDEIYDRIIKEMNEHVEDLPLWSESGYGVAPERLTRQAGYGVLARVCLHAAGFSLRWNLQTNDPSTLQMSRRQDAAKVDEFYSIADAALAKALNNEHSLILSGPNGMSGFQYLFSSYCKRNYSVSSQEMMWQLACLGETTNSDFNLYTGQPGSTGGAYGRRKSLLVKLPTYYLSFDPGDTRRDVTCTNYSVASKTSRADETEYVHLGTTYSSVLNGKFRIQWGVAPYIADKRNVDIPMLRYADILLMYAETQNYLHHGPTDEARNALQQVRNRAGVGHLPIPGGEQEFLETLMQERKWEFGDEFLMRTDLIRTDLLDKNIAECKQDLKDLSDHTGKFADIPQYRIYQYSKNSQEYGDEFLVVPFIEITDPAELALISINPRVNNKATFIKNVKDVVAAHGKDWGDGWYPARMFERYNSTYNKNSRNYLCGIDKDIESGLSIVNRHTGRQENVENRGVYPEWIDGPNSIFYGYKRNQTELSPLAAKQAGHIMIDNPRITQLPGYPGPSTL